MLYLFELCGNMLNLSRRMRKIMCLISNSYNVGNAETVEKQCNRLRFQLDGSETASTCSTNEQNVPLIKSQQFVVPTNNTNVLSSNRPIQKYTAHKEDETCRREVRIHGPLKYDSVDVNTRISSSGRTQKNTVEESESECRKRKRNAEQEIPRRLVVSEFIQLIDCLN